VLHGSKETLHGLSPEEADEAFSRSRKTGDPLVDYWEYRAAHGLSVDLDLEKAPPRSEWDAP
jgi:hypothetical protein